MSHIITNDEYYKNISNILRERLGTDYHYYPAEMPDAIRRIPQSIAGVDDVITGIYLYDHDEECYPTKLKVVGWNLNNKETDFPLVFRDGFYGHLKEVEFENCNFLGIKDEAFAHLPLEKVTFSDNIKILRGSVWKGAFGGCTKLKYVKLPASLIQIGDYCFYGTAIQNINLPNGINRIDNCAFLNSNLQTINLPKSLVVINNNAFMNCSNLEFVELGQDFNANNLNLSASTKYSRETILQWFNALADRTGQTTYKLIIGSTNLKKLTEEDIAIATAKNWTLS